jgi:hypothetical protein
MYKFMGLTGNAFSCPDTLVVQRNKRTTKVNPIPLLLIILFIIHSSLLPLFCYFEFGKAEFIANILPYDFHTRVTPEFRSIPSNDIGEYPRPLSKFHHSG